MDAPGARVLRRHQPRGRGRPRAALDRPVRPARRRGGLRRARARGHRRDGLAALRAAEPRLERYAHYFDRVRRRAPHLRSAEVEDLLAKVGEPFVSARITGELLADAELAFQPATGADGTPAEVAAPTFESLMTRTDRELRRSAWERYTDGYLGVRATLANALVTVAKQNVFAARARGYASALEAKLAPNAIPVEVYHSVIEAFRRNLPIWHRYWRVRQQALGLDVLAPYDLQLPLSRASTRIPYEQALDWVVAAVAPLGPEYVDDAAPRRARGALDRRLPDPRQAAGRVLGRHGPDQAVHLPELHRGPAQREHPGPRARPLDALAAHLGHPAAGLHRATRRSSPRSPRT